MACEFSRPRESDGVVEREAEDFVRIFATLVVEEILLEVIAESEERAALSQGNGRKRRETNVFQKS